MFGKPLIRLALQILAGAVLLTGAAAAEAPVRKVVLPGGGDAETIRQIVEFSGREKPSVLVFCTAARDLEKFTAQTCDSFRPFAGKVEAIRLLKPDLSPEEIRRRILASDIIWVSGGRTEILMDHWSHYYLVDALRAAYRNGTVMCGFSAGSICWTHGGYNDFLDGRYDLIAGIDLLPIYFAPHYQGAEWARFDQRLAAETDPDTPDTAWALTNGAALFFRNETPEIRFLNREARANRFRRIDGVWQKTVYAPDARNAPVEVKPAP